MNRRTALQAGTSLALFPLIPPSCSRTWLEDFSARWDQSTHYTLEVFRRMPTEDIGFQPIAEQRAFGRHLSHIAYWNNFYRCSISGEALQAEPDRAQSEALEAYYKASHRDMRTLMAGLEDDQLMSREHKGRSSWGEHASYWEQHSVADFLLRAFAHTAHHRAQMIVYLRLKGLEPPFYQF